MNHERAWQVWVDTGGTFTDAVALDPSGKLRRVKVLSSSALRGTVAERTGPRSVRVDLAWQAPDGFWNGFRFRRLDRGSPSRTVTRFDSRGSILELDAGPGDVPAGTAFEVISSEEAPVLAARMLTGTPPGRSLPPMAVRLATTLGTNALLERRGSPPALFITRGFGDLLRIGDQQRPDLFALRVVKPEPLFARSVEVPERLAADGTVLEPLDVAAVKPLAAAVLREGVRTAAVALLHAYRNPAHERRLRDLLIELGFEHVSCSSKLAPLLRILPRAETAVVDAYAAPVVRAYLERVKAGTGRGTLHVMTSAGGLVTADRFRSKDSLLSGPAGGVVGAAAAGARSGFSKIIAFDMGGTSTDVARCDGDYEYVYEHRVGDAYLMAPALAIESVAAGGGSVCRFDGRRFRVGPESAGARPGPACYGAGGPLTLTDVNLLLGRLDPSRFGIPVNRRHAEERLRELLSAIEARSGGRHDPDEVLEGFLEIANERMAGAIRRVSLRRGYDPAQYALVAFGGAGAQHACAVAALLDMTTAVVPPDAGLLSALGLGRAVMERFAERQVLEPLNRAQRRVRSWMDELALEARRAVEAEGVDPGGVVVRRRIAFVRFAGQGSVVEIEWRPGVSMARAFRSRYRKLFGHQPEGRRLELESLRVVASSRARAEEDAGPEPSPHPATALRTRRARIGGCWVDVPVCERAELRPGAFLDGPALVFEPHSATVVDAGWRARVDGAGALILRRPGGGGAGRAAKRTEHRRGRGRTEGPETVRLELFTHRFTAIAREMGERLRRTAVSTNVKERLDFSCALLDEAGGLVVNAPHIPVHLGALGLCVRRVAAELDLKPGDVVVTNHPAYGGSHLPDVTVITPVFARGKILGYVASRAHHAEIGGTRPGSMPPDARTLGEEGVVVAPRLLVRGGETRWDEMRTLLEAPPWPSRAVEDNVADLRAAAAANHAGARALARMAREHGAGTVRRYMRMLEEMAEGRIREALRAVPDGRYEAEERLDDGSPIRVRVEIAGDEAEVDFTGSAPVHPGGLNATEAVVRSAVIYVLRLMVQRPIPLNEGLMRAVRVTVPEGMLNPRFPADPRHAPAVVAGNVETSQRVVDTLIKALGLAACSQGTMNNVIFGNDRFGYYETVCGGAGAGPGFDGADAVHTHMTNTRITDPEVIEHRYPARVERFAIRHGSGGAGRFHGGEGAVREITFLEPVELSVVTQHRTVAPFGMAGGEPGLPGRQRVVRVSGEFVELGPVDGVDVEPGDRLILETPGGGGYGKGDIAGFRAPDPDE